MKIKIVRKKDERRRRLLKRLGMALGAFAFLHSLPDLMRELKVYRM